MADAFEEEGEPTVSIHEYLNEVEEQELEADLVLGGDEGKECTYEKGYMKRQAIFSCLTCTPDGNAGVCTACSLSCHDGHEWTKRNFRCDCGNSKFGVFFCKLFPNKDPENSENSYNHNFKGAYCTCGRPYPDPDANEQVEMIQCCICEDWFHENHIALDSNETSEEIPRDEEGEPLYEDFICQACAVICSFLTLYPPSFWAQARQSDSTVNTNKEGNTLGNMSSGKIEDETSSQSIEKGSAIPPVSGSLSGQKDLFLGEASDENRIVHQCAQNTDLSPKCIIGIDLRGPEVALEKNKPMFLSKNWRDLLCRCVTCKEFYIQKGIGYLIDREDTIMEYEKIAKQKREEKLQQQEGVDLNFLNKLGHAEKMEVLSGIADMKNELRSFLESFDSSKPVTSADVHQVFENLAKKRRRLP
uniref:UBR-type domain-containing protein n=1 Tax=Nelumbo nucifera TaxID=4432 RepID=A0A822YYA8_NELNU|nr:TPA_asm: hypothetical protein HUJ06_006919 [Nelumbo nucifera]